MMIAETHIVRNGGYATMEKTDLVGARTMEDWVGEIVNGSKPSEAH